MSQHSWISAAFCSFWSAQTCTHSVPRQRCLCAVVQTWSLCCRLKMVFVLSSVEMQNKHSDPACSSAAPSLLRVAALSSVSFFLQLFLDVMASSFHLVFPLRTVCPHPVSLFRSDYLFLCVFSPSAGWRSLFFGKIVPPFYFYLPTHLSALSASDLMFGCR